MTLADFDIWFALEICRYNNSIHSSLGCTLVSKWDALSGGMASDIPFDMDAFRESFLPSERRRVRRDGVHLFKIRCWSDILAGHIGRRDDTTAVRYDPRDLSSVSVELEAGRCVEARYRNLEMPPMSLWEYREARQYRLAHQAVSLRWWLWHGKARVTLTFLKVLMHDCSRVAPEALAVRTAAACVQARCETLYAYIANNMESLVDYGRRYRSGLPISSSRAEGAVDDAANARMGKRRRMRWSPGGAHLVAVTRSAVLDGRLTVNSSRCAA